MSILLALGASLAFLIWFFLKRQYTYWQRRGFPTDIANYIPFGCLGPVAKSKLSMGMTIYDVYKRCKERYVGVYLLFRPGVLIRDQNLARQILAQDFPSFHDRGVYVDEKNDPLSANLFSLRGQSWRTMRTKLAPSFSSGKLKGMFERSDEIGDKMVEYLNKIIPADGKTIELDMMEVLTDYAIDIVASVIFGLEVNSFDQPNNKFRNLVKEIRNDNFITTIFGMLIFLCPSFAKVLFKLGFQNPVALGLRAILKDTIDFREKKNIVRKDLLQMLMQLRTSGKINLDDENWAVQTTADKFIAMSMDVIAAQAFIFYVAGSGTTASTAALTLFELAQYPDLLKRAQDDVIETLERHNGVMNYESLQAMEYLELCLQETLRKYPGLPLLNRECTEDYKIPGTDDIIEKGTPIVISLWGIHRDPEYFPDPETYDPERFIEENHNYNSNAYMPFGDGPRHCIAQRMGRLNAKLAVAKILQNFNIECMSKRDIEIAPSGIAVLVKNGIQLKLSQKNVLK